MSNHESKQSHFSWMLREERATLSDNVVDSFLDGLGEPDHARTDRVRRLFVHKLLSQLHPVPVRHVDSRWSFGRWLEAIRLSVGLTRGDIAAAITDDVRFIERVEQTDVAPWQLKASAVADLICLFRLHLSAVEILFVRSDAVLRGHHATTASARSVTSDLHARGESARKALDLYLATKASQVPSPKLPDGTMDVMRRELERRRAFDLIGASE
jgi:hypothetical protein